MHESASQRHRDVTALMSPTRPGCPTTHVEDGPVLAVVPAGRLPRLLRGDRRRERRAQREGDQREQAERSRHAAAGDLHRCCRVCSGGTSSLRVPQVSRLLNAKPQECRPGSRSRRAKDVCATAPPRSSWPQPTSAPAWWRAAALVGAGASPETTRANSAPHQQRRSQGGTSAVVQMSSTRPGP